MRIESYLKYFERMMFILSLVVKTSFLCSKIKMIAQSRNAAVDCLLKGGSVNGDVHNFSILSHSFNSYIIAQLKLRHVGSENLGFAYYFSYFESLYEISSIILQSL